MKVLWNIPGGSSWMGGVNYYRNLYSALQSCKRESVSPVILTEEPEKLPSFFRDCAALNSYIVPPPLPPKYSYSGVFERIKRRLVNFHPLVAKMQEEEIKVISHTFLSCAIAKKIPTLPWIPDFQELHLPQFFSEQELLKREQHNAQLAKFGKFVILSSEDARKDFCTTYPQFAYKARVLPFVSYPPTCLNESVLSTILQRYEIYEPFIYVPNQLWAHKNHKVIIDALSLLQRKGKAPLIISTGGHDDHRNPNHAKSLQNSIVEKGLQDRFRLLGIVPFDDVIAFMHKSVALVNPSFFEGWSTTVEEAKSLGKRIILSDIAVHREQNPTRGMFFSPTDAEGLACLMENVIDSYSCEEERNEMDLATQELPNRVSIFAKKYVEILNEAVR